MIKTLAISYSDKFVSRWLILVSDIFFTSLSFLIAYLLRFNFSFQSIEWAGMEMKLGYVVLLYSIGFFAFNSFSGVIRHTSIDDVSKIFKATIVALFVSGSISLALQNIDKESVFYVPVSILVIHYLITLFVLITARFYVKMAYFRLVGDRNSQKTNVLIYGAGKSGIITKNTLLGDGYLKYNIVGFIDDNSSKIGKSIEGIEVFSPNRLTPEFLQEKGIKVVVISIQNISNSRKKEIVETCLQCNVHVKNVPAVSSWINGELSSNQIKNVNIDDLLGREPIMLNNKNISQEINDSVVLVTGAAGSIGSEISMQILHYNPKKLILLDQAESALFDLEFDINQQYKKTKKHDVVIGDITNYSRLESIFAKYKPQIIFHAAAYKHVPMMEDHPSEAISVNIFGTKNVADLAVKYKASKFVMVSTDKAVNPTNVMGATKRVAEIYIQSLNQINKSGTQFITTRFGNVLGSNGSVIPLFKKQIERGGPVLVTHPEITRYFMTIPEACQLVLEAGAMGQGGEIFIFDMGESVRIYDIAKKMIKLSGLVLDKDIKISFTGLRPGEKLYEELLNVKENTIETHHPKIMIAQVKQNDFDRVNVLFDELHTKLRKSNDDDLVTILKQLVPEYKSNNSVFEKLDKVDTVI